MLDPNVEIILFGEDEGAAEVCQEFGLSARTTFLRNKHGTKYLNYFFDRAQKLPGTIFCVTSTATIVLMSDFRRAVERVKNFYDQF